jgi:gas vesicle protein
VTEQNTVILGALVGAFAGAAVGYMYFTDNGRQWRESAERNFATIAQEAERLMTSVDQVRQGVAELRGNAANAAQGWSRTA